MIKTGANTASETIEKSTSFLSKIVYKTSYTLSYGVVLPIVYIACMLPSPIMNGIIDGAKAANDVINLKK